MGAGQSLMHLASDAVRAAAESPFLEEAVKMASAILCCISMPSPKQRFAGKPCVSAHMCVCVFACACATLNPIGSALSECHVCVAKTSLDDVNK